MPALVRATAMARITRRPAAPIGRCSAPAVGVAPRSAHAPPPMLAAPPGGTARARRFACRASATPATQQTLRLTAGATTITLPFSPARAKELHTALAALLATFSEKAAAERPQRWPATEFRFRGDAGAGELALFEAFCNPNAHASPFDAKVLVTATGGDGLSVMTEVALTGLRSDLGAYGKV